TLTALVLNRFTYGFGAKSPRNSCRAGGCMRYASLALRCFLFALLSLSTSLQAFAQFRAVIQGTVSDPKGAAVIGAKITATNQDTGTSRETVSGETGFYRFSEIPPGRYTVTVGAPGFREALYRDVVVEEAQPRGLDVVLQLGSVLEQVT